MRIGTLARSSGVTPQCVRKWERLGWIPRSKRKSPRGWRHWGQKDVALIEEFARKRFERKLARRKLGRETNAK